MLFVVPAHSADTCDAGYYLNDAGECEICPAGYFCSDGNQIEPCRSQDYCELSYYESGVDMPTGAKSETECWENAYVKPGYFFSVGYREGGGQVAECPSGHYCPGIKFSDIEVTSCNNADEFGKYSCGFGYTDGTGADSIDDCIPCPEIGDDFYGARRRALIGGENVESCNVVYFFTNTEDWSDLGNAAAIVVVIAFGGGSMEDNPNWKSGEAGGHVVVGGYNPDSHRYTFVGYNGTCPVGKYATPGSVYNEQSPGIVGDSVPAVFSVTTNPVIVYTSNIMAILGLRQMYFGLEKLANRFVYVKYGIATVLMFTGIKLVALMFDRSISTGGSICFILVALSLSMFASLFATKKGSV